MELYDPRMFFNCYSHARTKPIHPSYSYVSSRSVFTYYIEVEFKKPSKRFVSHTETKGQNSWGKMKNVPIKTTTM